MNQCTACGQENRSNATFCARCGSALPTKSTNLPVIKVEVPTPELESTPSVAGENVVVTPSVPLATPVIEHTGAPLPVGDVIAQRFRILELLASNSQLNRYRVLDLAFCTYCGYDDNASLDEYCHKCGAALVPVREAILDEQLPKPPEHFDVHVTAGGREFYGVYEQEKVAKTTSESSITRHVRWGRATDQGLKRDHNEDCSEGWIYSHNGGTVLGLFVVADGLGGQDSGEVASRMAVDVLWQTIKSSFWEPAISHQAPNLAPEEALRQAVLAANDAVYRARQEQKSQMSSTVTAALLVDETAHIANVGDSRTYVFTTQGLRRITKDHSLVQRLVDTGQIKPEEIYTHPRRNLIYQSVGDRAEVQVDLYHQDLGTDDRLVLCSDGLWEMVHDDGLEEVLLAESDPQRACDRLVVNANLAGGEDNISVIIVQLVH
jgi:serine/threonine protein phosphatase PrpC